MENNNWHVKYDEHKNLELFLLKFCQISNAINHLNLTATYILAVQNLKESEWI